MSKSLQFFTILLLLCGLAIPALAETQNSTTNSSVDSQTAPEPAASEPARSNNSVSNTSTTMSKPTSPLSGSPIQQSGTVLLGLLLVLFAIFILAWLVKRLGFTHSFSQGQLKVVTGLSLGSREKLVVVQVGEEQLLLGVTANRIDKLHVLTDKLSMKQTNVSGFAEKLKQARKKDSV